MNHCTAEEIGLVKMKRSRASMSREPAACWTSAISLRSWLTSRICDIGNSALQGREGEVDAAFLLARSMNPPFRVTVVEAPQQDGCFKVKRTRT